MHTAALLATLPVMVAVRCVDVAIIGGGPCGLATALALKKASAALNVEVFERDTLQPKGASIQISKAGWKALENIDSTTASRIRKTGTPVTGLVVRKFSGANLLPVAVRLFAAAVSVLFRLLCRLGVSVGFSRAHCWHDVRMVLYERVNEVCGSVVSIGHELMSMEEEGEALALRFRRTADDDLMEVRARIVLACDGIRSSVRTLSPLEPLDLLLDEHRSVWRGLSPSHDAKGTATFYRSDDGTSSGLVFPAGIQQGTSWTVISPVLDGRATSETDARSRLLSTLPPDCDALLRRAIDACPTVLEHKLATRDYSKAWGASVSRVAFLGDAAHPLRPTGEGTALAFEDAYTIGQIAKAQAASVMSITGETGEVGETGARDVTDAKSTGASLLTPAALRRYETARATRVREVSWAFKRAADQFYTRGEKGSADRGNGLGMGGGIAAAMAAHPMEYINPL